MRNLAEKTSPIFNAAEQVLSSLGVNETDHPRLSRAALCRPDIQSINNGLELLKEDPAAPLLLSFEGDIQKLADRHPLIASLFRYPNVRTIPSIQFVVEALTAFTKPKSDLLSEEGKDRALQSMMSRLRHDLKNALAGGKHHEQEGLLQFARKFLASELDDANLLQIIMESKQHIEVNEFFPVDAFCVDWDGTLMKDDVFQKDFFEKLRLRAQQQGLPFLIWTGGDVDKVYEQLALLGISDINVCSKQDCQGMRVSVAIDDEDLESLKSTYGFDVVQFEQAN